VNFHPYLKEENFPALSHDGKYLFYDNNLKLMLSIEK
jgi:hypothetical protein